MNFRRYFLILFLLVLTNLFITWCTFWQTISKLEDSKDIYNSGSTLPINSNDIKSKLVVKDSEEVSEEMRRIKAFEKKVISNMNKTVMDNGKKILAGKFENEFKVNFNGGRVGALLDISQSPSELLCDMKKKVKLHIFKKGDPFFRTKQLDQFFRSSPFLSNKTYNSCAVVTNSGSLINSGLGTFIDSHDLIIRFNDGPTSGFEKDVGSKTSLRVVNSQIIFKPEFGFLGPKSLYSSSAVLVWDPTSYTANVSEWYSHPDQPFFENFFAKRRMKPEEPLYLLHPGSLWSIWDWLQSHSKWPMVPHPTTSGFLGLAIAIQHCRIVRSFEYIPSLRYGNRCHYYGTQIYPGDPCTYGAWHPVSTEKLMALALNIGKKKEIYSDGFLTITGFAGLKC
ncbi:beta-galactoside alpha-2,6-sialyltransferase 2-like [Lepeophtheirus salmonis]|uniref:beta-galactoside alpha-2,6-sialyltransferase 2-like n=1 Tax=Lepeophtheirus salmonis TaxID=72036 RepID=UPI001AE328CB|nr:beta-galactoside alpha-2,6-sialyltransferase 2-like [Lepeophtheirus salmonis]